MAQKEDMQESLHYGMCLGCKKDQQWRYEARIVTGVRHTQCVSRTPGSIKNWKERYIRIGFLFWIDL